MLRDLSLHSVRRGGHNIPVTDLEGRAHSQGQGQSCAVVESLYMRIHVKVTLPGPCKLESRKMRLIQKHESVVQKH